MPHEQQAKPHRVRQPPGDGGVGAAACFQVAGKAFDVGCGLSVLDKCQRQDRPTPTVAKPQARDTELPPGTEPSTWNGAPARQRAGRACRIGREYTRWTLRKIAGISTTAAEGRKRRQIIDPIMDHLTMALKF